MNINLEDFSGSQIKFNKEVDGTEPLPRSTNISRVAWNTKEGNNAEWNMLVEFFPWKEGSTPSQYVYNLNELPEVKEGKIKPVDVYTTMVAGHMFPGDDRRSTGKVFHRLIKGKTRKGGRCPYKKVG